MKLAPVLQLPLKTKLPFTSLILCHAVEIRYKRGRLDERQELSHQEGEYSAILHYGTPMKHSRGVRLRLDGNLIKRSRYDWDALFKVKSHDNDGFEVDSFLEIRTILPKGRHILTLDALSSGINMDYIEFKRVEKERE